MGINSISYSGSLFGQQVLNLNNQLTNLSSELATGEKSTTYSGMGLGEGFAIAARAQLSNISAYTDTITNIGTTINAANTALQSLTTIAGTVQNDASTTAGTVNSDGQTLAQENALSQLTSMLGVLNTQVGNSYIFSGSATNTPAVATSDAILDGTSTQAGLKQLIAERAVADGTNGLGRLTISTPSTTTGTPPTTSFSVAEDTAGSPFGMKLSSVSSTLTGATVSGPSGSPAAVSFSFGATNPNPGDQVTLNFNLPDGTTTSVQLTASSQNPPPSGSFTIGATPAATAANLQSALGSAIGTVASTTLVAASAVAAGNDFFDPSSSATGAAATSQAGTPITSSTTLSGTGNALTAGFANGDTLTVNGTTISFSSTSATNTSGSPYVINTGTGTVGNLLSAIDSITGSTTPSSIDGGAVTINTPNAAGFSISTTSSGVQAALAAIGFSSSAGTATTNTVGPTTTTTISAVQPPLRVSTAGSVTGAAASDQQSPPQPITGATALSALPNSFQNGDSITVDGSVINFSSTNATSSSFTGGGPYTINVGTGAGAGNVGTLLSAVDSITGTTTPSTISADGAITINTPNAASFSLSASSSDPSAQAALASLGFSSAAGTATNLGGPGSVMGAAAVEQEPLAITSATALSGAAGSASLTTGFQDGDAITVDGTVINFSTTAPQSLTGPTYSINPTTGTVGNLLSAIDSITGTTTPSTISASGAITINTPNATSFSITGSDSNATASLAALGLSPGSTTSTSTSVTGVPAVEQETTPAAITSATALSGATDALSTGFQSGDSITVNGKTISFSSTGATNTSGSPYVINTTTGTVGNLLSAIDSITGTTTPSSITGGAVTINTPSVNSFSISGSDANAQAALAALGFSAGSTTTTGGGATITANASGLVNGSANTVAWYTGGNSANPLASQSAVVDSGISVQYGIQANEQAIRQQLEGIAVFAAMTESPTGNTGSAIASALSSRIATNLTSQPGQQQISDIQTSLANAQTTMQAASSRQTQTQTVLQNMIASTEQVSTEQVASEILAIQSSLSASYQTTSILSKLTLTNYLAPGA